MLILAVSRYCGGESERILGRMADGQGQSKVSIATKANPWGEGGSQDPNYLHCIRVFQYMIGLCVTHFLCVCVCVHVYGRRSIHTQTYSPLM